MKIRYWSDHAQSAALEQRQLFSSPRDTIGLTFHHLARKSGQLKQPNAVGIAKNAELINANQSQVQKSFAYAIKQGGAEKNKITRECAAYYPLILYPSALHAVLLDSG